MGFPGGSAVKNLPAMQEPQETQVQSLGWEDPLEEGIPFPYPCLDRGPWQATVHRVTRTQTPLKQLGVHADIAHYTFLIIWVAPVFLWWALTLKQMIFYCRWSRELSPPSSVYLWIYVCSHLELQYWDNPSVRRRSGMSRTQLLFPELQGSVFLLTKFPFSMETVKTHKMSK